MGRKTVDKTSLEYLCKKLFFKDTIIGFQYTISHRDMRLFVSLTKSKSCSSVIDGVESGVTDKIGIDTFGTSDWGFSCYSKNVTQEQIDSLISQFESLGYETETVDTVGKWTWLRVPCKTDEIVKQVENIKNNVKL